METFNSIECLVQSAKVGSFAEAAQVLSIKQQCCEYKTCGEGACSRLSAQHSQNQQVLPEFWGRYAAHRRNTARSKLARLKVPARPKDLR